MGANIFRKRIEWSNRIKMRKSNKRKVLKQWHTQKLNKSEEEYLIAENQRLRMENNFFKKLGVLIPKEKRNSKNNC